MPTTQTYYLNGTSLSDATGVFLDNALTTCAPDGWYSDGIISRQQVSCLLLPPQQCPSCATPCGIITYSSYATGAFLVNSEMYTDTGAILISFNPFNSPVGFVASFNSNIYNTFSSPVYGLQTAPATYPIFLGDGVTSGCDPSAFSPITLNEFKFDGSSFVATGNTQTFSVSPTQITGDDSPGECVMVIPKTVASPSIVDISIYAACESASFNISIQCPTALRTFDSSLMVPLESLVCEATIDQTYYVAHVNGVDTVLGLYDWVFSDINGEFILTDGYYKSTNCPDGYAYFQVANGIIINFADCL